MVRMMDEAVFQAKVDKRCRKFAIFKTQNPVR